MAQRTVVQCRACGNPYAARLIGDETIVLPTEDGRCVCGNGDMALPGDTGSTKADAERAE